MSNSELSYQDYDAVVANLKAEFPHHKSYNLRRGELREAVRQLAQQHGLRENNSKGGVVWCTPSIYFGWSVYEDVNLAVFIYRDGGMGWDTVMLMSKDKTCLKSLQATGKDLGLIKTRITK